MFSNVIKYVKKFILSIIPLILLILVPVFIITRPDLPSEEEKKAKTESFYKMMQRKDIRMIVIYLDHKDGNQYKIIFHDQRKIQKCLDTAKKVVRENLDRIGQLAQYYTIRLILNNNEYYNFGYMKMDKYPNTICMKLSINKYNDCGHIFLYRKPDFRFEVHPAGPKSIVSLLNIELIPFLREYVDKPIDANPKKYYYNLTNRYKRSAKNKIRK